MFIEKPLATDIETPRRILEALEGKDLVTSVGYMYRYKDSVEQAREMIAASVPVLARGTYVCRMPGVSWWRRKERSGGQVVEQTTHIFDLARYLLGEVEWVFCVARTGLMTDVEDYNVEDASICTLRFSDGTLCEITSSCALKAQEAVKVGLEVFTRDARLELGGGQLDLRVHREGGEQHVPGNEDAFLREDRAFIQAVLSGDTSGIKSSYADAFRTQAVTCAANASMATGEPVRP